MRLLKLTITKANTVPFSSRFSIECIENTFISGTCSVSGSNKRTLKVILRVSNKEKIDVYCVLIPEASECENDLSFDNSEVFAEKQRKSWKYISHEETNSYMDFHLITVTAGQ